MLYCQCSAWECQPSHLQKQRKPTVFHLRSLTLSASITFTLKCKAPAVSFQEVWTGSWILFCKVKPWLWYEGYERLSVKWCLDIFSQLVVILYLYLQGNIWHTNVHGCKWVTVRHEGILHYLNCRWGHNRKKVLCVLCCPTNSAGKHGVTRDLIGQCASRGEMPAGTERVSPVRVCILLYSVVNMEVQLKSSSKFPELVNHSVKAVWF